MADLSISVINKPTCSPLTAAAEYKTLILSLQIGIIGQDDPAKPKN